MPRLLLLSQTFENLGEYPENARIGGILGGSLYTQPFIMSSVPLGALRFSDFGAPVRPSSGSTNSIEPWHSTDLPSGTRWWGTYYAGFTHSRNGGTYLLSETPHTCPHCAIEEATGLVAAARGSDAAQLRPLYLLCDLEEVGIGATRYVIEPGETLQWPQNEGESDYATNKPVIELGTVCGNCGFPGHNRRTCWMKWQRNYAKIGLEIEGRFYNLNSLQQLCNSRDGMSHADDGSIARQGRGRPREFRTAPGTVAAGLSQLLEFYPDETDDSCGLHVHTSFECVTHITQLAHPAFFSYFKEKFTEWGHEARLPSRHQFFRRLNGRNSYCRPNIAVSDPMEDDRYRQLNFTSYSRHKTLECRMLPMFKDSAHAVSAVQKLIEIYETWLGVEYERQVGDIKVVPGGSLRSNTKKSQDIDLAAFLKEPTRASLEINAVTPPPPPQGWRRIVLTPEISGQTLSNMIRRAS